MKELNFEFQGGIPYRYRAEGAKAVYLVYVHPVPQLVTVIDGDTDKAFEQMQEGLFKFETLDEAFEVANELEWSNL